MSQRTLLTIANPDLHNGQSTALSQDVAVWGTTLTVYATTGFWTISAASDYYYLIIGNYWEEKTEIVLASAKTDSTFTTGALKFSHSAGDPITYIPYNQIKFYGRLMTGGSNNLLATLDIDCSKQHTPYEYTGTTYSYFVTTYYRPVTTIEESQESEEISTVTFTFRSVKKIIEAGLRKALTRADENPDASLGWSTLIDIANEGLNEILTRKKQWQCLHKIDNTQSTVASTAYVSKPSDLSIMEFMTVEWKKINFVSKTMYNQYVLSSTTTPTWKPYLYTIKNDLIYLYPTPDSAYSIWFEYYSNPTSITSLTDEVKQEFATILIYFIAAQAAYIRSNEKRGNLMEAKFVKTLEQQIEDVTWYEQAGEAVRVEHTSIYWSFFWDWLWD